jgi:hypothetical protein
LVGHEEDPLLPRHDVPFATNSADPDACSIFASKESRYFAENAWLFTSMHSEVYGRDSIYKHFASMCTRVKDLCADGILTSNDTVEKAKILCSPDREGLSGGGGAVIGTLTSVMKCDEDTVESSDIRFTLMAEFQDQDGWVLTYVHYST